ncbi:hypothetical protein Pka01_07260 [Planotetraspora kaengkrachanensis]|uniref:Uncharacterized protein n=1 Tax=Planotetraspora kaengkrachanensis TaxID=575193 RepID=A0A8J3PQN5_9ACTN|nr:hypothetical protein Pka01_07260 [Planotetraspora kaengkrachanensis]
MEAALANRSNADKWRLTSDGIVGVEPSARDTVVLLARWDTGPVTCPEKPPENNRTGPITVRVRAACAFVS